MNIKKLFTLLLISLFTFSIFAEDSEKEKSIIKIEKAQKSEYKKDKETNTDTMVLSGNVVVSVSQGSKTTKITADKINYNRANDMIYAEGNVVLEQSSGGSSGGETVTAKSLLFNTLTLEGIFDNGKAIQTSSDALNLPSGSKLIVDSDIFGRDSSGTISFKSGNLTFCDDENPHWRIKATRIWLLPGGEFAFLNAVLYVGRIPLLWLPAFYYPKDELIFNPSFGYKNRTGYFFNTTTYLYGRKSTSSTTSSSSSSDDDKINFFSLMNTSSQKEQVREGLILHNTDKDFTGNTSNYVKVMADYYANLGVMTGIDAVLSPNSYLTSLVANMELGFSHTIFESNGVYIPYNANKETVSDSANFMSFKTPFRYQANLKMTFAKPFSLTVSLPIYSDPFFGYDFNEGRQESMDWIGYAMNGGKSDDYDDDDDDITETSSFTWNVNGNYKIPLSTIFNPFISSLSISSFSSSIVFSSKTVSSDKLKERDEYEADSTWATYTPERKFFYPSQINPIKVTGNISGTLIKIPSTTKSNSSTEGKPTLVKINEFKTDEELKQDVEDYEKRKAERLAKENGDDKVDDKKEETKNSTEKDESKENVVFEESVLPLLDVDTTSVKAINGLNYSLSYSIVPDFSSQISYSSSALNSPEDFSWNDMQSTFIQVKAPTTLSSSLGFRDSFFNLSNSFTFNPYYQKHPYLKEGLLNSSGKYDDTSNGGYSESSISSIKTADHNAKKLDLSNTNSLTLKPFYFTEHFSGTSISWNSSVKMIQTKYIGTDPNEPEWEYLTMELWSSDCVTTHNLSATLSATEDKFSQSFTMTSTLPPQVDAYHGTLSLGFPYVNFSASSGIKQKSKDDDEWIKEDLSQSLSISLFSSKLSLSQSYVYDLEEKEHDSFRFALSGFGAQLSYVASYVSGYYFSATDSAGNLVENFSDADKITARSGWIAKSSDEKRFQPYQLNFAYTNSSKTFKYWSERISFAPTLSTSVVYDFLRPTSSYFIFKPGITFKINNFLDLSFSAETRDSVIFRYFCPDEEYKYYYAGNGERNFVKDLINSFRFDDEEKRKASGFKLKSLNVKVSHDLDDWDLNCEFKISPRLVDSNYDFSPYFSISVAWRPLSSMKTEIVDEYGDWQLNP